MARYYATGVKQTTKRNEEGKKEKVSISVVIDFDPSIVTTRIQAVNEANRIAKKEGIVLDSTNEGVHVVQGTQKGGNTITKRIQKMKTNGTLPKF